jgi:chromate reductase
MRLVAISGSLDTSSVNSALVHAAASLDLGVEVEVWDELADVPPFRPDSEGGEHVASLRRAIGSADVVLIATPEYAGGMPGMLKNALDWLVGTGELYGRRVVVVSAAPSAARGGNARRWVEDVARMQGALVADSFTVALSRTSTAADAADASRAVMDRVLGRRRPFTEDDGRLSWQHHLAEGC